MTDSAPLPDSRLAATVEEVVAATPVLDIHTHLYDPAFGGLFLWGIDELLVYHYLVAEAFRHLAIPYDTFWSAPKTEQAQLVWDSLFIQHSPLSESCRGLITTLNALGFDLKQRDLPSLRRHFAAQKPDEHLTRCMELANVSRICMTNSPFDDDETKVWEQGFARDERFVAALRIDPLLLQWNESAPRLRDWGYDVSSELNQKTFDEVRRFLGDWAQKIGALYVMVSLPPSFRYPDKSATSQLLESAVLPFCREHNLPFAMMMGVQRAVNPNLQLAGDGVGPVDLSALQNLLQNFSDTKFLVTLLPREGQHELCVLARKFRNLHVFGCWWFTNIPHLIDEITRMRIELLGTSFTPQHSDARVFEQIIYKWRHSKAIIARVLLEKYSDLSASGWPVSRAEIERDAQELLGGGFERFLKSTP